METNIDIESTGLMGWVVARPSERNELEELGVELGPYQSSRLAYYGCSISEQALKELQKRNQRFPCLFIDAGLYHQL